MFKKCVLLIVVGTNIKTVNFLHLTFDLDKIYTQFIEGSITTLFTSIKA